MIITHEGRDWEYEEKKITTAQAIVIKNHTGLNVQAWLESLGEVDPLSWQAMWWLIRAQNGIEEPISSVSTELIELMEAFGRAAEADDKAKAAQNTPEDVLAPSPLGAGPIAGSAPTSPNSATGTSGILPISAISPPPSSMP